MKTTFISSSNKDDDKILLTNAVLPVPGDPEIYRIFSIPLDSFSVPRKKSSMMSRSFSRPSMLIDVLEFDMERNRARICASSAMGAGGVGGGVLIERES